MSGFILGFILGILGLLIFVLIRMMRNDGWDKSNLTNPLRLLEHVTMHGEDFGAMYYLSPEMLELLEANGYDPKQPFWYISEDELKGVVKSRPDFKI